MRIINKKIKILKKLKLKNKNLQRLKINKNWKSPLIITKILKKINLKTKNNIKNVNLPWKKNIYKLFFNQGCTLWLSALSEYHLHWSTCQNWWAWLSLLANKKMSYSMSIVLRSWAIIVCFFFWQKILFCYCSIMRAVFLKAWRCSIQKG